MQAYSIKVLFQVLEINLGIVSESSINPKSKVLLSGIICLFEK